MTPEFNRNHFDQLGMPLAFSVDASRLESANRDLQGQVHPDRFAAAPEAERRVAMQWATRANEAYRTLKDPVDRRRTQDQVMNDVREHVLVDLPEGTTAAAQLVADFGASGGQQNATIQYLVGYTMDEFLYIADQMDKGHVDAKTIITHTVGLIALPDTMAMLREANLETKVHVLCGEAM